MQKRPKSDVVIDVPVRIQLHEISRVIARSPKPAAPIMRYQREARGAVSCEDAQRLARLMERDPAASRDAHAKASESRIAPLPKS